MTIEAIREAAEVYRAEHSTWDVERLMAYFADDVVWQSPNQPAVHGKQAVRAIVERMASNPAKRRMTHLREFMGEDSIAVEWKVEHAGENGEWLPYRFGVNIYDVVDGKITGVRLYGFLDEAHKNA
jgi:ketosteroid isomerase-like protein